MTTVKFADRLPEPLSSFLEAMDHVRDNPDAKSVEGVIRTGTRYRAIGWIDMVLDWNRRGQMDADAVRVALMNAKEEMLRGN